MRLLDKYHPRSLTGLYGQKTAQQILTGVLKDPKKSPRIFTFYGDYGTGKTSATQVFARSLNCDNPRGVGKPCGVCPKCTVSMDEARYYKDWDCGIVGNVEATRSIHDDLSYGVAMNKWQVAVFDEFHMASRASQGALLKVLDNLDPQTFVIFVTTDLERVIETVRSRAVNVPFEAVSDAEAISFIKKVAEKEEMDLSKIDIDKVVIRAGGHIRDLLKELELVKLMGYDAYDASYVDYEMHFLSLLLLIKCKESEKFEVVLNKLCRNSLAPLKAHFYSVLDKGMKHLLVGKSSVIHEKGYEENKRLWKNGWVDLFRYSVSEYGDKAFEDERLFRCFMRSLYIKFSK